jgi:hypothetical protein
VTRDVRGVVYAEFLIAFFPLFTLFTGTVQLALIAQASLVVRHAAVCAVRKAIVVLDDDPAEYDGEPRNALVTGRRDAVSDVALGVLRLIAEVPIGDAPVEIPRDQPVQDGARLAAVRSAAYLPLAAVAPPIELWTSLFARTRRGELSAQLSLAQTLGDSPWWRVLQGYGLYARFASAVSFPRAPRAPELRDPEEPFGRNEPVVARVTYVYPCTVPWAAALVCAPLIDLAALARTADAAATHVEHGELGEAVSGLESGFTSLRQSAADRTQLVTELGQAELPGLAVGWLAATSQPVVVLRGEAALPNQAAPYRYASEREDEP